MAIEDMNREELKQYRAKVAVEFEANIKAISIRKAILKKLGVNANKGTTTDEIMAQLYAENDKLMEELRVIKKCRKELPVLAQKKKAPRGNRPANIIHFGNEWDDTPNSHLNAFQRRLVILMAREIGQDRYQELKRIATDDFRAKENTYYSGGYVKAWEAEQG